MPRAAVGIALGVRRPVFQRPPQALDGDVAHPAAATVYGDRDAGLGEGAGEGGRGELRAMVALKIRRISRCTRLRFTATLSPLHHRHPARTGKTARALNSSSSRHICAAWFSLAGVCARQTPRARHPEDRALLPNRQRFVGAVEHRPAVPARPSSGPRR
jgi:hypothetical protein